MRLSTISNLRPMFETLFTIGYIFISYLIYGLFFIKKFLFSVPALSVKDMSTNITDLPLDVMSEILSVVAKAPDGARDIARSMPTCQFFLEASKNNAVRRAVCFDNAQILRRPHLFRKTNGLLFKCTKACNPSAEFQLAQVILTASSKLMELGMDKERFESFRDYCPRGRSIPPENAVIASFLTHFIPTPGTDPNLSQGPDPRPLSYHWEFVKVFILKSTKMDIINIRGHVRNYIMLFTECKGYSSDVHKFLGIYFLLFKCSATHADSGITVPIDYYHQLNGENVFEDFRAKVLHAYEVIIPELSFPCA